MGVGGALLDSALEVTSVSEVGVWNSSSDSFSGIFASGPR